MQNILPKWIHNFSYFPLPRAEKPLLKYIVFRLEDSEPERVESVRFKLLAATLVVLSVVGSASMVVPSLVEDLRLPDMLWVNVPKHTLFETFGGLISIIIALILSWEYSISGKRHVLALVFAFLSMGILDIFHAHADYCHNTFVWLHSSSAFLGALFFMSSTFIFAGADEDEAFSAWFLRLLVLVGAILILIYAIVAVKGYHLFPDVLKEQYPHHTPVVEARGQFTGFVHSLNLLSGLFFLLTGIVFLIGFWRTNDIIYLIFGGSSLLFFESEFLFFYSKLWDFAWWYWHAIKGLIFSGLLLGLAYGFTRTFYGLHASRKQLALFVEEIEKKNVELQKAYDNLKETQRYLTESERLASIGKMAATLAHEIKNPLGAIANSFGVLTRYASADENDKELQQIIETEMERLNKLVEDFLSFSRPTRIARTEADIHQLIDEVLALLQLDKNTDSSIVFLRQFDPAVPLLMIDRDRIKQLLLNVFINAAQAMPDGGEITARTLYNEAEKEVEISIVDTGVGISEEVLPQVFQPFFSTKDKGLGLGLNIVFKTAQEHGGYIAISSKKGEETRVQLNLPLVGNTPRQDVPAEESLSRQDPSGQPADNIRPRPPEKTAPAI